MPRRRTMLLGVGLGTLGGLAVLVAAGWFFLQDGFREDHKALLGALIYPQQGWGAPSQYEPLSGYYDSSRIEVLDQQVAWMRHAGIDFALWQWIPDNAFTAEVINRYRTRPNGLPWAVQYESKMDLDPVAEWRPIDFTQEVPDGSGEQRGERFARHMRRLIDRDWAASPGYFSVDGRPVVYLWAFSYWRNWTRYVDQVFEEYRDRDLEPPFFIGVVNGWADPQREPFGFQESQGRIAAFSPPIMVADDPALMDDYYGNVAQAWERWKRASAEIGAALVPTVMPGFDYTKVNPAAAVLPREGGETLRRHYQLAYTLHDEDTPLLLLKSFNDFPEGDAVEPAVEYGTLYIDLLHDLRASN